MAKQKIVLGEFEPTFQPFHSLEKVFFSFKEKAFKGLSARKKFEAVNSKLLALISEEKEPCFLLPAVIDFIATVNREKLLLEPYDMLRFEFWLNHHSNLSTEENGLIRCKIVGKKIDRTEYQLFFPIGQNRTLGGSHFVAAHLSPDVDTTIASFWGWVDAFGARVGSGMHQWALPGIPADSHTVLLFQKHFNDVLQVVARHAPALTLSALDLVTQSEVIKLPTKSTISHVHSGRRIIAVDEKGHFKGDWRASDAERCRWLALAFYSFIRWLEHTLYYQSIAALAQEKVRKIDIQNAVRSLLSTVLQESEPAKEYGDAQKTEIDKFLKLVLKMPKGLKASYRDLLSALEKAIDVPLMDYDIVPKALFTPDGRLLEDRTKVFQHLEKLFRSIADASAACRRYLERLDLLLAIKHDVLEIPSQFITLKSEVEEIRTKMSTLEYLTVAIPEEDGEWFPVGVVYANDLKQRRLGTVSLRDFSNVEETKMASYLEVVSVIDHHKTDIKTSSASTIIVGDAQSANTIVSEQVLKLNVRYSLLGMSSKEIESEKKACTPNDLRKLQRLLQLALNARSQDTYIHPIREYSEYLFFLHAILDDTDLLTKVTNRDIEVVATLLNRMKSIACKQDMEIISFDDIPKDANFTKHASRRILQHEDMYSIYKKIYEHKEHEVEKNLAACVKGQPSTIFTDTKEQNGCARIGQTKLFSTNFPTFSKHADKLRALWLSEAKKIYERTPQIDLHMQMISTIASADEVYHGRSGKWNHSDELWIWIPPVQGAIEHLVNFLNAFLSTALVQENEMDICFLGANYWDLELIFSQNFPKARRSSKKEKNLPIAVLSYKAGLINSRKAYITPYLPRSIA